MKQVEAKNLAVLAKGLFPEMTTDQGKLLAANLSPYQKNRAEAVIKTHRGNHEFFSFSQLMEGLRSDQAKAEMKRRELASERIIDWLRYEDRHAHAYAHMTDMDALAAHFRRCWTEVSEKGCSCESCQKRAPSSDMDRQRMRALIRAHAMQAFRQIGFDEQDARDLAGECVGLSMGESIRLSGSLFKGVETAEVA